jgi:hypothetical protein
MIINIIDHVAVYQIRYLIGRAAYACIRIHTPCAGIAHTYVDIAGGSHGTERHDEIE